jgi:hypothetical protein
VDEDLELDVGLGLELGRKPATDSSRGTTTRVTPRPAAKRAPSALDTVICVDPCTSSAGHTARASSATAGSCTITASTPAAATWRSTRSMAGSSGSNTSVLSVR